MVLNHTFDLPISWQTYVHARVLVREFRLTDLEPFCDWQQDEEVGQFVDWLPRTREQAEEAFRDAMDQQETALRRRFFYAIEVDSTTAGSVGYTMTQSQTADCGWFVRRGFWNQGLATVAVGQMMQRAFVNGILRLTASVKRQNASSIRVAERCGFLRIHESNERLFFECMKPEGSPVLDDPKDCSERS